MHFSHAMNHDATRRCTALRLFPPWRFGVFLATSQVEQTSPRPFDHHPPASSASEDSSSSASFFPALVGDGNPAAATLLETAILRSHPKTPTKMQKNHSIASGLITHPSCSCATYRLLLVSVVSVACDVCSLQINPLTNANS